MPTDAEWAELRDNCTWKWTSQNFVPGYLVTASNGNSIFIPAAGYWDGTTVLNAGSEGYYWSSSLYTDKCYGAWDMFFVSYTFFMEAYVRFLGQSVRPVTK